MRAIAANQDRQATMHTTSEAASIQGRAARMPVSARALPVRAILRQSLAWWAAIRAAYLLLTLLVVGGVEHQALAPQILLQSWQRWDANWYIHIAQAGFTWPQSAGFFPLYPLLITLVAHLPGLSPLTAALLIANCASLVAFCGVGLLAATEAGTLRAVPWALGALAAYPVAYFLVAPFSEGLCLATVVFALLAARQGWWPVAALCAFLAGLTRPTSVALVPALLWEYGRQRGWWASLRRHSAITWAATRAALRRRALPAGALAEGALVALAVPAALGGVVLFDWWRFGDPLLYLHAEDTYWYHAQWPFWMTLSRMVSSLQSLPANDWSRLVIALDLGAFVIVGVLLLAGARRIPLAFFLYGLGVLYLPLCAPIPTRPEVVPSMARYLLMAVPIFLLAGRFAMRHRRLGLLLLVLAFAAQALLAGFFLLGIWVE